MLNGNLCVPRRLRGSTGVQAITNTLCTWTGHCEFCKLLLVKTLFNLHFNGSLVFLWPLRREVCFLPATQAFHRTRHQVSVPSTSVAVHILGGLGTVWA